GVPGYVIVPPPGRRPQKNLPTTPPPGRHFGRRRLPWQGEDVQPATEREWVGRARDGDRAAFAALVELYWDRIRRWVYSLTRDAARAEDLTQDAFVKAWIGLPALETPATFRSWLFRIARNLALDSQKGPRGVAPQALPETLPGREAEPLERLVERENQARL